MISGFEAGKKYLYRGRKQQEWARGMTFMLDGKPHKCVFGQGRCARFVDKNRLFHWGDLSDFEEAPTYTWTEPFKRGDKVKAWDNEDTLFENMIFLAYIEGARSPYVCTSEYEFEKGDFVFAYYKHAQRTPEKKCRPYTLSEADEALGRYVYDFDGDKYLIKGIEKELKNFLFFNLVRTNINNNHSKCVSSQGLMNDFIYGSGCFCGKELEK